MAKKPAESKKVEAENEAKPAKPAKASEAPEGIAAWRTWGVIGVVLVGGVVGWKLLGSTYKGDVETICNAEKGSGFTIDRDMPKVTAWVREHLATPEGNRLYSELSDIRLSERGKRLQGEADAQKIGACPMVSAYQELAATGEYRADLQHLCSVVTFPHLPELDDAGRLDKIEDWIAKEAKSPRTKELAEPLRQGTPADRAKLLRDTATKLDVFSCDTAKTLETPRVDLPAGATPTVRVYQAPQINGDLKADALAKAIADATPAMVACYKTGLATNANLAGKVNIKFHVTEDGRVRALGEADSSLPDRNVMKCILDTFAAMKLPHTTGPMVAVMVPLELTTKP